MKILKRILKLCLLVLLAILTSCSIDELEKQNSKNITGTWYSISFIADEPLFDVNSDGINSKELLDELPCRYSIFKLNKDKSFYQENNTWQFNQSTNSYSCTSGSEIAKVTGKWEVNSEFTLLSLEINGNIVFLNIEFEGDELKFSSSETFLDKNAKNEQKNIYGKVIYKRN